MSTDKEPLWTFEYRTSAMYDEWNRSGIADDLSSAVKRLAHWVMVCAENDEITVVRLRRVGDPE